MARINIEDSLFRDPRFQELQILLGDRHKTLGVIVEAFIVAQEFYLTTVNDRLIPLEEWKKRGLCDKIIEVGLAEKKELGVYVCGSKDQFNWVLQRQNAGKMPKTKRNKRPLTTVNDRLTTVNDRERVESSISFSSSISNSFSDSNTKYICTDLEKSKLGALDELNGSEELKKALASVNHSVQKAWLAAYQDSASIKQEILKAVTWIEANPRKRPKIFSRFMTNWLARWYERERKLIPSTSKTKNSAQERTDALKDQFERVQRGEL